MDIPRRIQMDLMTPAELAIMAAVDAVEKLPPDVRLTDAVVLLERARNRVADYVDAPDAAVCGKRCDHDSECLRLAGHDGGHETQHGCLFYDTPDADAEEG